MLSVIQPEKKRLIVLLPDSLAGNASLAYKIQWTAIREHCNVLYLVLTDQYENALFRPGNMGGMVTDTAGTSITADSRLVRTSGWLQALRELIQPQDVIVCLTEQSVRKGWSGLLPLAEYVQMDFPNRVIHIPGFYKPIQKNIQHLGYQLLFLIGCAAILGLFTALEITLDHSLTGAVRTVVLCAVVCCEFGAVYGWNNLIDA